MRTKQELEQAIVMHEEALASSQHSVIVDTHDLEQARRDLKDLNKPELTEKMYDVIFEAIEEGIGNFDFDSSEQYDIEYELDYDGKVNASNIEFNSASELNEKIMNKIEKCFKVPHIEQ
jgi:hypothetical protein